MMNKLYFTDNIEILRKMDKESVDLICTDPPFFRVYNEDNFHGYLPNLQILDNVAQPSLFDDVEKLVDSITLNALEECLKGLEFVNNRGIQGYLKFMSLRLVAMHRVLAPTGSIYLQCIPSTSHYLKVLMDVIFGANNFKNEIIWGYKGNSSNKQRFPRMHDTILFYGKSEHAYFNPDAASVPVKLPIKDSGSTTYTKGSRIFNEILKHDDIFLKSERPIEDYWVDINDGIETLKLESPNYPTQKPRRLYERMIKASSKEGDLVLDPFCGSGTTLDAAQALKRRWIGIDMSIFAMTPIEQRLKDRYGLIPTKDYEVKGYPKNMQEVKNLADDETKASIFSYWAATRLDITPSKSNDTDADIILWSLKDKERSDVRFAAEVKTGKPCIEQVRQLQKLIQNDKVDMCILITLEPVTSEMREIAEEMDKFKYHGLTFPSLQFWQITEDYFNSPDSIYDELQIPGKLRVKSKNRSEGFFPDIKLDLDLK